MEQRITVVFTKRAATNIAYTAWYIVEKGYPDTAQNYLERLYAFGRSLANFPDKYPLSNNPVYRKHSMHCAVFEHTYVFIYKLVENRLIIYSVIHCKRLK